MVDLRFPDHSLTQPHQETIPIEDAIRIADVAAKRWRPTAELQFITSQDIDADYRDASIPGQNGQRRAWNLQFKDPVSNEAVIVGVRDGHEGNIMPIGIDEAPGIDTKALHVSGASIIRSATSKGLLPGVSWALGYHFVLKRDRSQPYVAVLGLGPNGQRQAVFFDPFSGDVMVPETKITGGSSQ